MGSNPVVWLENVLQRFCSYISIASIEPVVDPNSITNNLCWVAVSFRFFCEHRIKRVDESDIIID